jgi:citrate lyase subunit beta/citryl-CoA lyase
MIRPRRSVLYMPGSNARALDKAKGIAADALIFDLEDSVAPDAKETARRQVADAVRGGGYGRREIVVRVNGLDTDWGRDDIRAMVETGVDALLVPKVSDAHTLKQYEALINDSGAPQELAVWTMMETARAVLNVKAIAATAMEPGSRLAAFVVGTNDLAKELKAAIRPGRASLSAYLSLFVAAARGYGLAVIDGVYGDIRDEDGFARECAEGKDMGFDGKTLIHPSQVDLCNLAFAPTREEIDWARKVIAAFEAPENRTRGAISLDGRMVERLHADEARGLVELADAIAAMTIGPKRP